MKIRFIYQSDDYDLSREIIISKLCEAVSCVLELPTEIEVKFAYLGESVYGNTALGHRFKNRININSNLTIKEIPDILVHELIHLNQVLTGILRVTNSHYYWRGRAYKIDNPDELDYNAYKELPWEADVANKQHFVMRQALLHALKRVDN